MKKLTTLFIVLCFACAEKEDPMIISDASVQLKYDGKHQFTVKKGASSIANAEITWKSSDEKVGTVNITGNFSGRKIGKTEITAATKNGTIKASVEITPYSTLYTEPVVNFNQSMQTIKSKEKRKLIYEDADNLLYEGENSSVELVLYSFIDNKLDVCGPVFNSTNAVMIEVATFLKERYPSYSVIDGDVVFLDDSKTYGIILSVDSDFGLVAVYAANDPNSRTTQKTDNTDKFKKTIARLKGKSVF